MKIRFEAPGQPVGKGRPRFTSAGRLYTPKATLDYEDLVRTCFQAASGQQEPVRGIVNVTIEARYKIPNSWPKWKKNEAALGRILPTVKPDVDNIAKIILDALNGVAYEDDKNVTSLRIDKRYSNASGVTVTIETDGDLT